MKILLTSTILFLIIFISPINAQNSWTWQELSQMPEKVSNNAIAAAIKDSVTYVYSFMGIDSTKLWSGIHLKAFRYNTQTNVWDTIAPVPDNLTRIAASANTVKNKIYIIGGYHVYSNNSEVSSNKIFIYDPQSDSYSQGVNLPVAIDDQVQVVWRDSLIFIITGWSNSGNVSSVQIYNPALDTIMLGTPVPNNNLYKAFGASGVIIGDTIYYCGGVEHSTWKNVNFLRKGVINPNDPSDITWTNPATNPGDKGYRMGAVVYGNTGFWIGGAGNSYNFNGIAYDGTGGVDPLDRIMAYHAKSQTWEVDTATPFSVMDLRNIAQIDSNQYIIAGGMLPGQEVSNRTFLLTYSPHVISIINASCSYNCDGQAVVTGLSGVFPYSYQWDDPANQTNDTATGLCPGTYTVMVIDAVPDTAYATVFIGPDTLTITATSTFNSCNGDTSKSITVSATGGTSPYEYSSDGVNFQISSTLSGLAAGNYDIYVRDANNCRDTAFSVTITDPPALSGTLGSTDESFAGANDGTVWVNESGGVPPYSYLWMPGSMTGDSITGLSPDTFTVTVTDSNGCIFIGTDTVFSGPVGMNELFNVFNNVKLYPNPANKKIYIKGEDIVKVILYDLMGKTILVTQTNIRQWVSLDISTLKDGIYMLKVVGKNKVYTRKVQIQL